MPILPTIRAFVKPDGSLYLLILNEKLRQPGETDADVWARVGDAEKAKDPIASTCPTHFDVDRTTFPPRSRIDGQGDQEECRSAWRENAGSVVINEAKIAPNWGALLDRLRTIIGPAKAAQLAGQMALLREIVRTRDKPGLQALYDRMKAAQGGADPPFTIQQWQAIQDTLGAKHTGVAI